ncbi:MAG: DoxX-like family protein [Candidatus Pristimantibacillus sp.]
MRRKPIYVETDIQTEMETLWSHTQTPELHEQWDLRFSEINYLPFDRESGPQRFLYRTRIGFGIAISGTGETKAKLNHENGERLSTLTFGSEQPISLISRGGGYWKYKPNGNAITFLTHYDYETRFGWVGGIFDRILFRPLFGFATAWSFDALRLWLEKGIAPAISIQRTLIHYFVVLMVAMLWIYEGFIPKLLFPEAGELAMFQQLGWFAGYEVELLQGLGVAEIGVGVFTLIWHRKKIIYGLQIGILVLLAGGAILGSPELIQSPFNPLTLSGSMIGFCLIAAWTVRDLPEARRCLRQPIKPYKGGTANGIHIRTSSRS